ncbi:MAG: hypothetical protein V7604_3641 [Hyphomicrobiales bacterium]|jgi:uncharacterized membrane protein
MIADPHDHIHVAHENQWALQLIALVAAIIIVAGMFFVLNSASKEYAMADAKAPPALNSVPLANPAANPAQPPAL